MKKILSVLFLIMSIFNSPHAMEGKPKKILYKLNEKWKNQKFSNYTKLEENFTISNQCQFPITIYGITHQNEITDENEIQLYTHAQISKTALTHKKIQDIGIKINESKIRIPKALLQNNNEDTHWTLIPFFNEGFDNLKALFILRNNGEQPLLLADKADSKNNGLDSLIKPLKHIQFESKETTEININSNPLNLSEILKSLMPRKQQYEIQTDAKQQFTVSSQVPLDISICYRKNKNEVFGLIPEISLFRKETFMSSIVQKNTITKIGVMVDKKKFFLKAKYFKDALNASWNILPIFSSDLQNLIALIIIFDNKNQGLLISIDSPTTPYSILSLTKPRTVLYYKDSEIAHHDRYNDLTNLLDTLNFSEDDDNN